MFLPSTIQASNCPYEIHSVEYRDEFAYLTIAIPENLLFSFQQLIKSSLDFINYTSIKLKHQKSVVRARDEVLNKAMEERFQKWSALILSRFDSYMKQGFTWREAAKKTKAHFPDTTCYMIEIIVRQSGRLSKRKKRVN